MRYYPQETIPWKIDNYFPSLALLIQREGILLGGGALRVIADPTDEVCDIDLFFTNTPDIIYTKAFMEACGYSVVFQCPIGYLTSYKRERKDGTYTKVQLITRDLYTDAEELVDSFDISACCAAWDGKVLTTADNWRDSVTEKVAYINNVVYPVATINRIAKYKGKGYHFPEATLQYLVKEISDNEFDGDQLALYID